jgi:ribonucleoside-diphosphate reductase alpha chain
VRTAVRFLDDVLDVNHFVLEDNKKASQTLRRLGLGVMGLADALIKMDLAYDSEEARSMVEKIMDAMREEATAASEALAKERGVFPLYAEHEEYFKKLGIRPRRNVALLTVAPTGTTSMLMGVSSGIEPVFAPFVWRRIGGEYKALVHPLFKELLEAYPPAPGFQKDGSWDWDKVTEKIQENHGSVQGLDFVPEALQRVFKCAHDVSPLDHVRMQGAVQRAFDREGYVGNSLSKTINLPNHATVEDVEAAYTEAWRTGCKGVTVYRDGSREFQVISTSKKEEKAPEPEEEKPLARPFGKPVFERTGRLFGFTDMVKLTASDGTRYSYLVTVNMQGEHPIEVILTTGKAGDEQNADAEALGRVVSIALQYGVPPEAIVHTLRGINGGLYGSYFKKFVASKGDLIALALEQSLKLGNGHAHPLTREEPPAEPTRPY